MLSTDSVMMLKKSKEFKKLSVLLAGYQVPGVLEEVIADIERYPVKLQQARKAITYLEQFTSTEWMFIPAIVLNSRFPVSRDFPRALKELFLIPHPENNNSIATMKFLYKIDWRAVKIIKLVNQIMED